MVVSYDQRGNGRSPAPPGWQTTSAQEHADDTAGLLQALVTGPAAVFSTSSGGNFTLCLLLRHPRRVRGAILHEPGLYALAAPSTRCGPWCGRWSRRRWRPAGRPAAGNGKARVFRWYLSRFSGSAEREAGDGIDTVAGGVAHDRDPCRWREEADQVEESGAAQVSADGGSALRWLGRNQPGLLPPWMRPRSG